MTADVSTSGGRATRMSIVGLAANPGTAVLPMCSMGEKRGPSNWDSCVASSTNHCGQWGLYGCMVMGYRRPSSVSFITAPFGMFLQVSSLRNGDLFNQKHKRREVNHSRRSTIIGHLKWCFYLTRVPSAKMATGVAPMCRG